MPPRKRKRQTPELTQDKKKSCGDYTKVKTRSPVVKPGKLPKQLKQDDVEIPHGDKFMDATVTHPIGKSKDCAVILTHGAGGDKDFHQLVKLSERVAKKGYLCLRFTCRSLNLAHRVKVYESVIDYVQCHKVYKRKSLFVGGRSMGARAAVGVTLSLKGLETEQCIRGVICLSYPLHTKDNLRNLRDEPLRNLVKPVLFISGTADEMCNIDVMERTIKTMTCPVQVHWISRANHALSQGKNNDSTIVYGIVPGWCNEILSDSE